MFNFNVLELHLLALDKYAIIKHFMFALMSKAQWCYCHFKMRQVFSILSAEFTVSGEN